MHLEKYTITMWEINTVSLSNYRKFLGLYPNRPFSQYYSFLCRIYTSTALGDILHRPRKQYLRSWRISRSYVYQRPESNMKNMKRTYSTFMILAGLLLHLLGGCNRTYPYPDTLLEVDQLLNNRQADSALILLTHSLVSH